MHASSASFATHPRRSLFHVDVRSQNGRAVVFPCGELDIATAELLEERVLAVFAEGTEAVVLDPQGIRFIDSTGLRLLLRLDAHARSSGCSFALLDCEGPVRRLLTLTRLLGRFQLSDR